ncbi:MAG: hypothetical protein GY799_21215 [Desulfobulbaceae bacterium]|nr:hypothetical protein [Desulfobulbaceae bacterium]
MKITVEPMNSMDWRSKAFDSTVRFKTDIPDFVAYMMEHSPIRVEHYCVDMRDIPVFVSVHMVRHKIGVEHFCLTQRDDRGGIDDGRWTPTDHLMIVNAQSLINISRDRLCLKSHKETVKIMSLIKRAVAEINPALADFMVPNCVYRGGICKEWKNTCGKKAAIMRKYNYYRSLFE